MAALVIGQHQHVARINAMRVLDLGVLVPDFGPFPGVLQEYIGDAPQRIAALDGVLGGRRGLDQVRGRRGRRLGLRPGLFVGPDGGIGGRQLRRGRDRRTGLLARAQPVPRSGGECPNRVEQPLTEIAAAMSVTDRPVLKAWLKVILPSSTMGWGSSTAVIIGCGVRHTTYCQVCALDHAPTREA